MEVMIDGNDGEAFSHVANVCVHRTEMKLHAQHTLRMMNALKIK